jgi:hypothetical protein
MIGDTLVSLAEGNYLTYPEIEELRALNFVDVGKPPIRSLSQITEDLGHVRFGSVICGTGDPFDTTSGNFSGMGIFNPPLTFTAGDYHLVGCNAGVLQAGISADDGKFYAGAGAVILDKDGLSIDVPLTYALPNSVSFISGPELLANIYADRAGVDDIILSIKAYPVAGNSMVFMDATATAGNIASILMSALSPTGTLAGIFIYSEPVLARIDFYGVATFNDGIIGTLTGAASDNVLKTGDTMTGALTLDVPTGSASTSGTAMTLRGTAPSGTPAAGLGLDIITRLQTSDLTYKEGSLIRTSWSTATTGSQKARLTFFTYDTGARNCLQLGADGSAAMIGFLGAAAVARPSAYTQTYSTADKTLGSLTAATLTDNTGGTANTTLAAVEATYTQATIRNNFADLAAMVNKNTADHLDLAQLVNALIDDLQALGLVA